MSDKQFLRPITLGKLKLANNIFYSPLAGCSDYPFRYMANKYRPGLYYCEMVKMDALVRYDPGTFRLLDYSKQMHPIAAQLVGSKPELAGPSAKIIEDLGFDLIDLNCGCPVDKVTKDGSGSGLLKNPQKIGDILSNIVASVQIPVTVKIRTGWDSESIIAEEITRIAEEAGAKIITIHGRTRQQAYKGNADWEVIRRAKQSATNILVFGNGDIFSGKAAREIFEQTGCDGVLLSRGTLGKPWLYEEVRRELMGEEPIEESGELFKSVLLEHTDQIAAYHKPQKAAIELRKIACWYLKSLTGAKPLREQINKAKHLEEIYDLISNFEWGKTTPCSKLNSDLEC